MSYINEDVEENYDIIIEILEDIFGDVHHHNDSRGQISFDCPVCSYEIEGLDEGDGKGNLEINYQMMVYKCWSCCESHNTKGRIFGLIKKYGSKKQLEDFKLFYPKSIPTYEKDNEINELPSEYINFNDVSENFKATKKYKDSYGYLINRNITPEIIKKYNIGFCPTGKYHNRIIIPSFDKYDKINYFVSRTYINSKPKYLNPEANKEKLVFNEKLINWKKPIQIVEGPFDALFVDNPFVLLGKVLLDTWLNLIYEKAESRIELVLDGEAMKDTKIIYDKLNGGKLFGRIYYYELPYKVDIADLKGDLSNLELKQYK
jgi:hypothetical protein